MLGELGFGCCLLLLQLMQGSVLHPIAAGLPRKFHKPQKSDWEKLAYEVRGGVIESSKGHAFPQLMVRVLLAQPNVVESQRFQRFK